MNIVIVLLALIALLLWEIEKSIGKIARYFGGKTSLSWKINVLTRKNPLQFMVEPVDSSNGHQTRPVPSAHSHSVE